MYHMLSGRRPFEAHNTKTVISKVLKGDLLPLSKVAPLVSKDCCKLVNAMMNMNVDKRPADAKKLLAALDIIVKKRSHKFLSYLPFYSKFAALTKMKKFFVLAAASAVILLAGAGGERENEEREAKDKCCYFFHFMISPYFLKFA